MSSGPLRWRSVSLANLLSPLTRVHAVAAREHASKQAREGSSHSSRRERAHRRSCVRAVSCSRCRTEERESEQWLSERERREAREGGGPAPGPHRARGSEPLQQATRSERTEVQGNASWRSCSRAERVKETSLGATESLAARLEATGLLQLLLLLLLLLLGMLQERLLPSLLMQLPLLVLMASELGLLTLALVPKAAYRRCRADRGEPATAYGWMLARMRIGCRGRTEG